MLTVPQGALLAAAAVDALGAPALAGALVAGAAPEHAPRMIPNVATTAAKRRGPCRTRVMSPPLEPAATRSADRWVRSASRHPHTPQRDLMVPPGWACWC